MFDRNDLRAAVEADVLSADQAGRLENFLTQRADPGASSDTESLRFLANLNDIFIAIGILILVIGLTAVTGMTLGVSSWKSPSMAAALVFLPVAGVMWAMAEYFCRRRRLLLPSMALATVFTLYVGLTTGALGSGLFDLENASRGSFTKLFNGFGHMGLAGFGGAFFAAMAFYLRFRLPFALLLVALALAGGAYTGAGFFGDIGLVIGGALSFLVGLGTLVVAIGFDARDPARATRNSDNAFWLHLAAAPQIILGLRGIVTGSGFTPSGSVEAITLLVALVAFGMLSLALNRRALIVSGLLTFGLALTVLVSDAGGGVQTTLIVTTLLLGGGIVFLGGGWKTARRALLAILPKTGLAARIFPPEPA
ncbi:MAG: hypothetical protein V3V03_07695 [Hyphomonadaceae bacterium]